MSPTILVTGAAGFIGSAVVCALFDRLNIRSLIAGENITLFVKIMGWYK